MRSKIDHYAIVIGIDQYAQLPTLHTPSSDVSDVVEWMRSTDGCNLPDENIQVFQSAPVTGQTFSSSGPEKWAIDRALREFGVQGGAQIGERLTFYFAGYSLLDSNGDLILLMSDWSPDTPENSLNLTAYEEFFREAAPFEEIVFILDTQRLEQSATNQNYGMPEFARSKKWTPDSEVAVFSLDHHPAADDGVESRGYLTRAILEGFSELAAGGDGQITAVSLGRYAVERVASLMAEANIRDRTGVKMTPDPPGEIIFGEAADDQLNGTLMVELPHWTAEIYVFDHQYREISDLGSIDEVPPDSGSYRAKISLPKGVYKVEAHLEGQVESQFVLLHASKTAWVKQDSWKSLSFKSAAPLAEASSGRKNQMSQAESKSLELTWPDAPGGSSRLFLFLRTENPEEHSAFYKGLKLLDHAGEEITDFSQGIKRNSRGGWMAFNADLPPGYYVLRRGRKGVRVRQQPIYLCAGWETHVFLQARDNFPSLGTMALDMSPMGAGFHANDIATAAAEAVLCSLGQSGSEPGIVVRGRLQILLDEKINNPWLGILASYALLRADLSEDPESVSLLEKVLAYLQETIGDHPDVRALHLSAEQPAAEPFWNPPILRAGLVRVQTHATRHAATIPLDCLCDVVLDNHIVNSPWTAWRHLDRKPLSAEGIGVKGFRPRKKKTAAYQAPSIAQTMVQSAPPDLPVYQYSLSSEAEEFDLASAADASEETREPAVQAALLQQVQAQTAATDFESRPESINVTVGGDVDDLLANIAAEDVSQASGIPLARAERGMKGLQQRGESSTSAGAGLEEMTAAERLSADEQVVYNYAVQKQAATYQQSDDYNLSEADAALDFGIAASVAKSISPPPAGDQLIPTTKITIEDTALSLRTEADRVFLNGEQSGEAESAHSLADRLYALATALLEGADYMILIDPEGHISYSNGAFLGLITPEVQPFGERSNAWKSLVDEIDRQREHNRRLWEESIRNLQPGEATMVDPLRGAAGTAWVFKRTAVNDESGSERAALYAFRLQGSLEWGPHVLPEITAIMPELTFNSSMFAYSSGESARRYLHKIEGIVAKLEAIVYSAHIG